MRVLNLVQKEGNFFFLVNKKKKKKNLKLTQIYIFFFPQDRNIVIDEVTEKHLEDGHSRSMGMVMVPAALVARVERPDFGEYI